MKLHLCCGRDDLREILQNVLVTKTVCVATDAHILATYPTAQIFDADFIAGVPELGVLIHREDWPKIAKPGTAVTWKDSHVIQYVQKGKRPALIPSEDNAQPLTDEAKKKGLSPRGRYQNWEAVVPQYDPETRAHGLALNASMLANLQNALDIEFVCLIAGKSQNTAILVKPEKDTDQDVGQYGIIMPVKSAYFQ